MHAVDAKILRSIVDSTSLSDKHNLPSKELQSKEDLEEFPSTKYIVINELSKRITQNLTYKVSREAYQRYSVRLHVIETLRDWSRLKGDVRKPLFFQDSEESSAFFICLFKKYVKLADLSMCSNMEHLIQIAKVLLSSIGKHKSLVKYFGKVIEKIISLEQTEKSEQFLKQVLDDSSNLQLELTLIEKIFVSLKTQFVEKPLTNCFLTHCSNHQQKKLQLINMTIFFKKVIDSTILFSLLTNYLRELFIETEFAKAAQDFIQTILRKIEKQCNEYHKEILDLYPLHLQYCVILLRINQINRTNKLMNQAEESLQEIYFNEPNDALMLVSHYPDWLPQYLEFSDNLDKIQ